MSVGVCCRVLSKDRKTGEIKIEREYTELHQKVGARVMVSAMNEIYGEKRVYYLEGQDEPEV